MQNHMDTWSIFTHPRERFHLISGDVPHPVALRPLKKIGALGANVRGADLHI